MREDAPVCADACVRNALSVSHLACFFVVIQELPTGDFFPTGLSELRRVGIAEVLSQPGDVRHRLQTLRAAGHVLYHCAAPDGTVAALERPEQPAGRVACQPSALRRAVKVLRALESSLDFQAELLAEQRAVAASTGYSSSNFAYGSTPLQSWVALFDAEPVRRTLSGAPSAGLRYVVLGSSLGSLVLYGACVHGLHSRGIELLPLLARTAERIAAEAGVVGASFECADMLSSDLKGSDIVLLASQCWDRTLIAAVRRKLLCELPLGALVLDYTAALGEVEESSPDRPPPLPPSGSSARRAFALACTVHAPVSWDGSHCFWVWRVVEEQPASYSY